MICFHSHKTNQRVNALIGGMTPMKNNQIRILLILIVLSLALGSLGLSGLGGKANSQALPASAQTTESLPTPTPVPAATALRWLREGNVNWRSTMAQRNWANERIRTASGQNPFAVVIA